MVKKIQLRKMLVKRERSLILGFHALCNRPHWLAVPISISLKLEWRCASSSKCVPPELSLSWSSSECMTLSCWVDCWKPPAYAPLLDCRCDWNNRGVLFIEVQDTGTLKRAGRNRWSFFPLDRGHEAKPAQLFLLDSVTCCRRCSLLSSYHDLGVPLPLCGVSPIELQTTNQILLNYIYCQVHTSAASSCTATSIGASVMHRWPVVQHNSIHMDRYTHIQMFTMLQCKLQHQLVYRSTWGVYTQTERWRVAHTARSYGAWTGVAHSSFLPPTNVLTLYNGQGQPSTVDITKLYPLLTPPTGLTQTHEAVVLHQWEKPSVPIQTWVYHSAVTAQMTPRRHTHYGRVPCNI